MKILTKYILRESASYFLIALLAFTGLLFTMRLLKFSSLVVNKGVEPSQLGWIFLSIVPTFLEVAIPLASLLGVMLAFARLSGDSELVVLRGSGVSLSRLILPVLLFGGGAAIATLVVSIQLKPWGFRTLNQTFFEIARTKTTSGLAPGVFNDLGTLTLYANEIEPFSGGLKNVFIDDRRDPLHRKIVVAKSGVIRSNAELRTITIDLQHGTAHEVQEPTYTLTDFDTNTIVLDSTDLFPVGTQTKDKSPREMRTEEIRAELLRLRTQRSTLKTLEQEAGEDQETYNRLLRDAFGQLSPQQAPPTLSQIRRRINRLKLEDGTRYALPAAALILALIGMPLGIQPARSQRTWGASISVMLGLFVFVLYYGLQTFGRALAENYVMDPYVASWLPNLICLVIGGYAIGMVVTERWNSIADGGERILYPIRNRLLRRGGEAA